MGIFLYFSMSCDNEQHFFTQSQKARVSVRFCETRAVYSDSPAVCCGERDFIQHYNKNESERGLIETYRKQEIVHIVLTLVEFYSFILTQKVSQGFKAWP